MAGMGAPPVTINLKLTVGAGVGATNGGNGSTTSHDKLIKLALILPALRLGQHHVLNIQPGGRGERKGQDPG